MSDVGDEDLQAELEAMGEEGPVPNPGSEVELHNPYRVPDEDDLAKKPKSYYAWEMRLAGISWQEIADRLGYASPHGAENAVNMYKKKFTPPAGQKLLEVELERLDKMQMVYWRPAMMGDTKAAEFVLKVMGHRAKLLGMEKSPTAESTVTNNAIFIGGSPEEYRKQMERARQAAGMKPIRGEVIE